MKKNREMACAGRGHESKWGFPMKTNAINNMRAFHSRLTVAALAALFTLPTAAGAAPNYGLSFNGTSAYVGTSTGVIPSSGDFTVEFWAVCPAAPSTYKEILSQGSSGNALYIGTDTANNIRLGDAWGTVSPAVAFPVGGWHHFAVVKSSANTIFYLDGTNRLARGSGMANPAASTGLQFGCQYGGIGEYWPGSIGDVRVWSEALSAAQIAASLTNQLTGSEGNLVANWQFKEGAGTTCTSIGPTPVVGTLINGPVWIAPIAPQAVALGTTNLTESPVAGSDSVALGVTPAGASWTATANASWLHVTSASGTGSTNVIFTFDANTNATRTGTLTVAGQTVTITQAGSCYVPANPLTTLVSSGVSSTFFVAVDGAGNVDVVDDGNDAIEEWTPSSGNLTTLISGLSSPWGAAVDATGNVCYYDTGNNAVKKWNVATSNLTVLFSGVSGLNRLLEMAVDSAGNVIYCDSLNTVKRWNAASNNVTTLVSSNATTPLYQPNGVAADVAGNVYIADSGDNAIKVWNAAGSNVTTLVSSNSMTPLYQPNGVAVDGAGNVYIADTFNDAIKRWNAVNSTVSTVVSSNGLYRPRRVAVDRAGNVYIGDELNRDLMEAPRAFVCTNSVAEGGGAGSDALPVVLPATANLAGVFAPASDQPWLTITGAANGVVSFSFSANPGPGGRTAHITLLGQLIPVMQSLLGLTAEVAGPAAGTNAVVLAVSPANAPWSATANASWLHLSTASGTGSTNVLFTLDANTGATRTGTLTIAGQTLTVTQAGVGYLPASSLTSLISLGSSAPYGVAVDGAGNVYISGAHNLALLRWNAASQNLDALLSGGLIQSSGVAVDGAANVYFADAGNNAIQKWDATAYTQTTPVTGLNQPRGVAVDGMGNIYIADTGNNAIEKWTAAGHNLTTLVSGLNQPLGVAVDGAGNVYFSDTGNNAIKEWNAASHSLTTLVSSNSVTPLNQPCGVAVDGAGNVYIADTGNSAIKEWNAASHSLTTLASSGLNQPSGVALDGAGNVYIADTGNSVIEELPCAFVNLTPVVEGSASGNVALPVVLSAAQSLSGPFAPASDQSWLTITGITNGVVSLCLATNTSGASRTAHISLLGQTISVTQAWFDLGATILCEGPKAGADSVVLATDQVGAGWTATANAPWLHLTATNGSGSTNLVFTFDVNTNLTRSGTVTIANQTLTVVQAGTGYVLASPLTTLVSSPTAYDPRGVAVDGVGNVYIADTGHWAVDVWNAASQTGFMLVYTGLMLPYGVAVDGSGNIYIADTDDNAIKEWNAASQTLSNLVSSGLSYPHGVALDAAGNVYIADTYNEALKKWNVASNTVTTLASGLFCEGVAVDRAGNVYYATGDDNGINQWNFASQAVVTNLISGLNDPEGVAVDGAGNVYIADTINNAIEKWSAVSHSVTTLVSSNSITPLYQPQGVAVDGAGNVYFADTFNNAIEELPRAFVCTNSVAEGATAGSDALPAVLPAGENLSGIFAPSSDQPWLTITGVANGVVSFSFTANTTSAPRTANITLLAQTIPITQSAAPLPPTIANWTFNASTQFQIQFTGSSNSTYTVLSTTNVALPLSNWVPLNPVIETSPGQYQFTDTNAPAHPRRFYLLRWP